MNYALICPSGDIFVRRDFGDSLPLPCANDDGYRWVQDIPPEFDERTQFISAITPVVGDVVEYAVIDHSPSVIEELDSQDAAKEIEAMESRQHRAVREAILTGNTARLNQIESDIASLRARVKPKVR